MNITDVLADVNEPEGGEGVASLDLTLGKVELPDVSTASEVIQGCELFARIADAIGDFAVAFTPTDAGKTAARTAMGVIVGLIRIPVPRKYRAR